MPKQPPPSTLPWWKDRRYVSRFVAIAVLLFAGWRFLTWPDRPHSVTFRDDEQHVVSKVIDGDTLELANGDRVRLIGIDTPEFTDREPEPFAVEARKYLQDLVEGKTVRLEYDRERFDKYRRVLAFVWIDDTLVNEELVRAGLAKALTRFGYSTIKKKRLKAAEKEAREKQRGIWTN